MSYEKWLGLNVNLDYSIEVVVFVMENIVEY